MAQGDRELNDFHGRSLTDGPLERPAETGQAAVGAPAGGLVTDYEAGALRTEALPPEDDRTFADRGKRRAGNSDRVLWAVIVERLEAERRLDLSGVQVLVQDGEVTLNGTVKHKADKRRIEDLADIDGIKNVQNNLRAREKSGLF
jgi:hypothetical protein